jgi:hypothetical protein
MQVEQEVPEPEDTYYKCITCGGVMNTIMVPYNECRNCGSGYLQAFDMRKKWMEWAAHSTPPTITMLEEFGKFRDDAAPFVKPRELGIFPNNNTNKYIDQLLSVCNDNDIEIGNLREEVHHLKDVICTWQKWYDYYSKTPDYYNSDFPEAPGMQHVYKPTPCGGPGEPPCKGINEERYGNTKFNDEKGE